MSKCQCETCRWSRGEISDNRLKAILIPKLKEAERFMKNNPNVKCRVGLTAKKIESEKANHEATVYYASRYLGLLEMRKRYRRVFSRKKINITLKENR